MKNYIKTMIASKKQYKEYKRNKEKLPASYKQALDALETYMWSFAGGDDFLDVLEEILQMFQEAAMEHIPVQNVMGEDPVEFADSIMAQYPNSLWLIKMREKLRGEIQKIDTN